MKNKLIVLLTAVASVLGVRAYAHHSFAATYFEDEKVTIHVKLVQFLYRNPHSFVHVDAPDDKGEMRLGRLSGAPAASWAGPAGCNAGNSEAW
jgi:hypothetical protein